MNEKLDKLRALLEEAAALSAQMRDESDDMKLVMTFDKIYEGTYDFMNRVDDILDEMEG